MESVTVGRVLTEVTIENVKDQWEVKRGLRPIGEERSLRIPDALVDTGAFMLSIPGNLIRQLGLDRVGTKRIRTSLGVGEAGMYEAVRLTIGDRSCTQDVLEVPDGTPVLIGQLPLEQLDFVVDMRTHQLIGNPRHGGEYIIESYGIYE